LIHWIFFQQKPNVGKNCPCFLTIAIRLLQVFLDELMGIVGGIPYSPANAIFRFIGYMPSNKASN